MPMQSHAMHPGRGEYPSALSLLGSRKPRRVDGNRPEFATDSGLRRRGRLSAVLAWPFGVAAGLLLLSPCSVAEVYELDAERSQLRVLVYRAGAMAKLGHNHVVSAGRMQGEIHYRAEAPEQTRFRLRFPVQALVVDDPRQRAASGADFAAPVAEDDAQKTRANMLGPQVLAADRFPVVEVTSQGISGTPPQMRVRLSVEIRDVRRELQVPVQVHGNGERLRIRGALSFAQSAFGIEPLRIMLGAIAVRDELTIEYDFTAVRRSPE